MEQLQSRIYEIIYDDQGDAIGLNELDYKTISIKRNKYGKLAYIQYQGLPEQRILMLGQILISYTPWAMDKEQQ